MVAVCTAVEGMAGRGPLLLFAWVLVCHLHIGRLLQNGMVVGLS